MKNHFPAQITDLPAFDGPFNAFQLTAENCKVLFASYPAKTDIAPHMHDTDNVGVITQGKLSLTVNGSTTHYGVGEWYHVPAQVEHSASFDEATSEIELWFKAE